MLWHQSPRVEGGGGGFILAPGVEVDVVLVRRLGESQLGTAADVTENAATDGLDGAKDAVAHQLECPGDGVGLLFGDIGRSRHIQCFPETFKWDGSQCHLTVIS